ncbi:MAG TPA: hypothetical protein VF912_11950 [Anaeromyxobacter sp.]
MGDGRWGQRREVGGHRFDAPRWRDRGYGESGYGEGYGEAGYGEGSAEGPEPTRAEPWREGEP